MNNFIAVAIRLCLSVMIPLSSFVFCSFVAATPLLEEVLDLIRELPMVSMHLFSYMAAVLFDY